MERVVRLARLAEAHGGDLLPAAGREGHGGLVGAGDGVVAAVGVLFVVERERGMEEGGGGAELRRRVRKGRFRGRGRVFFVVFFNSLSKFSSKTKKTHLILLGLTWMPQIRPGNMLRSTAT